MKIRIGFELVYECSQPIPMILMLNVHPSQQWALLNADSIVTDPPLPMTHYRDSYDNVCTRLVAPQGLVGISTDAIIQNSGDPDSAQLDAVQSAVQDLPEDALLFLLPSRYCDSERLLEEAWKLFGKTPEGWARVQAICDFVHEHVSFGYQHARPTRTAWETLSERKGVCRDFAHLAIALCRCMNIPARYCTGYLGDIGVPYDPAPMDFSGWFEAYLGGERYTFDARHNKPRIGRVLIARGRDAADVAISTTFGLNTLKSFRVWTDEVAEG
jgi:transglutaminase-like putative cysteine protease